MLNEHELKNCAQLMKNRFMEDPGVIFQLHDLDRAELLIEAQFEGQIQAFMEENAVQILEGGKGLLIGYSTKELPEDRLINVMQQSSRKLVEIVTEKELQVIQERAIKQSQIIPQNWQTAYCDGDVYHLLVIVTDKSAKGTGIFRKLITPVLEECATKKEPIILETFNPDNLPIYEHFGFQLMESHSSDEMELTCYCMMHL
ncbi:MAG: hypothetical protein L6276_11335 [Acetobacterium sp.]|nr:hypothetical protein [Bacillota bacterium]MCG2730848.1 hypothetical protein [Acetobacterium sp.]